MDINEVIGLQEAAALRYESARECQSWANRYDKFHEAADTAIYYQEEASKVAQQARSMLNID